MGVDDDREKTSVKRTGEQDVSHGWHPAFNHAIQYPGPKFKGVTVSPLDLRAGAETKGNYLNGPR